MSAKLAPLLVLAALCTALSTAACSRRPQVEQPAPAARRVAPALRTTGWVVTGGRISVLVRNVGNTPVGAARAVISARDRHGNVVASISGAQCCTVTGLVPGATAGVYADLGRSAQRVTAVQVRWAGASAAAGLPLPVRIGGVGMRTAPGRTVVTASLTSSAPGAVRPEAILRSAGGSLVAVLAGIPVCLATGTSRAISMMVAQVLPPGTVIAGISTYRVPDSAC